MSVRCLLLFILCPFFFFFAEYIATAPDPVAEFSAPILQHMNEGMSVPVPLTERQLAYVHHLADGLLDKQIAHAMGISHSGVRKHQAAVCRKLDVTRRSQIVAEARRRGIFNEPEIDLSVGPKGLWDTSLEGGGKPEFQDR